MTSFSASIPPAAGAGKSILAPGALTMPDANPIVRRWLLPAGLPVKNISITVGSHAISGHVARGYEGVAEAFARNFESHGEIGAACAVFSRGSIAGFKQLTIPWHREMKNTLSR